MHVAMCALSLALCGQVDVQLPPGADAVPYGIQQPAGPQLIPADQPPQPTRRFLRLQPLPRTRASSYQPTPPVPPSVETLPPGTLSPSPGITGEAIELFPCVTYERCRRIAPCAVPTLVKVRDPCDQCCDRRDCCCEQKCVYVEVCAPPCDCPRIRETRDGYRVVYDVGKYRVEVISRPRRGDVIVVYHD